MLRLIAAPAHRQALRIAHRLRLVWWRVRQPQLAGCRVLLVRHAFGSGRWMLPGGGLGRGETPLVAAAREFAEETGCTLLATRLLEVADEPLSDATNRVHLVTGRCAGTARPDGREIAALAWFDPAALPADLAKGLSGRIDGWIAQALATS